MTDIKSGKLLDGIFQYAFISITDSNLRFKHCLQILQGYFFSQFYTIIEYL